MTNQTQVIMFCVIGVLATPLGVLVAIKTINKLVRAPVNTLQRSGDIELVEFIEPTRPQQIYNYPDLLESPGRISYSYHDRVSSYLSGNPPSYLSGNPPSYRSEIINSCQSEIITNCQSVEGTKINSCLENENIINSYFIILIFIFFLIIFLKMNSIYSMCLLIPFSFFEIDFRDSFDWKINSSRIKSKISYLKLQTLTNDIELLLLSLVNDVNYSMTLSFISSYKEWQKDKHKIQPLFINDAIIVNKESDSLLITQFIMENIKKKGYFISNRLFNDLFINSIEPVILTVTVPIEVEI